ncbi:MAG TPA: hypothetical protein VJ689_03810 [Gaiellaceae bacterium]|nr:hypothetical protein [Gaiellaceae bacterium]
MRPDRRRLQLLVRVVVLGFVIVWLFSGDLQLLVPAWVPLVFLLAAEAEFVLRGWREARHPVPTANRAERRAPGAEDADLGWGEVIEDEEGAVHYVPPPPRPPRPRFRRLVTAVVAVAAVALFVLAFRIERESTWHALSAETRQEVTERLSREASRIAGRQVTVRCDEDYRFTGVGSDALGVAFIQRGLAYLEPGVCRTLHDLLQGDRREREATGEAVLVLAHEAVHLGGERREGVTECRGLQEGVELGERLGLPTDRSERLMSDRYERSLAERDIARLAYRLPAGCRNGGDLDLRPNDDRFP